MLEEQRGILKKRIHRMKQKMTETTNTIAKQLQQTMWHAFIAQMDVAEFYSPPRITSMAAKMGLRVGWSMDITTNDIDGRPWDFKIPEMGNRATRRVLHDKPTLLMGSPMCIVHSVINIFNHYKMPPEVVRARFTYAREHLKFATYLYKLQIEGGRYFLHEHPDNASSLVEQCIHDVLGMNGVNQVVGDQGCYELTTKREDYWFYDQTVSYSITNGKTLSKQRWLSNPQAYTIGRWQSEGGTDLPTSFVQGCVQRVD